MLQWIPGHIGVTGNETADAAAARGHYMDTTEVVPFTKTDARSHIRLFGKEEFKKLWISSTYHYKPLFKIDPCLRNISPRNLPRNIETLYHRIRLNVAYTNKQRYKYGQISSPNCQQCLVEEDLNHIFTSCPKYNEERLTLLTRIQQLTSEPYSFEKALGAWEQQPHQRRVLDALITFLHTTNLIDRL